MTEFFPVGKLPADVLANILAKMPQHDPRVRLGPGIGLDCAVIDFGETNLVFKIEPITFASSEIGWYAVQIAVNDISTTGALPKWMLLTALLPEGKTTEASADEIFKQVSQTCADLGIDVIGGHTEITYGIDRPILVSTVIGEVPQDQLITPKGALAGDHILVTKGIPIEATALLAREFPERLSAVLTPEEIAMAQQYLFDPGISVFKDARIAVQCGGVHAMHDPTEGGIATALLEMATASQKQLVIDPTKIPMPALSLRICRQFDLDPLGTIASGALLLAVDPSAVDGMLAAYQSEGILAADIGLIHDGAADVLELHDRQTVPLRRFVRDEITRVYETAPAND